MKFEKKFLDNMPRCYSASSVTIDNQLHLLLASEEEGGSCYAYSGSDFEEKTAVWESAGGTMSLVEIPETNGEFLATQNFFPGFKSATSKVVWVKKQDGKFVVNDFISIPYLHRFDVLRVNNVNYFIACVLCGSKKDRDDWSDPGKVYVGVLPDNYNIKMEISPLIHNLTKNHGYFRGIYEGKLTSLVTCDEGIFAVTPPSEIGKDWSYKCILNKPVSDVAAIDLDGCGELELATIEPFHGDKFNIYKKINGEYKEVYSYPEQINFAHAVVAATLDGKPSIIGGIRRVNCELFYIQYDKEKNQYFYEIIESGVGTSNAAVVNLRDKDIIIAANHTKNEAALYILNKENT